MVLVVTPDAVEKKDEVIEATKASGFAVATEQEVTLTEEQCVNCFEDPTDELKEHLTRYTFTSPPHTICDARQAIEQHNPPTEACLPASVQL